MADIDPTLDPNSSAGTPASARWTIAQLAVEFGLTTRALRFYEEAGLIHPVRDGATRRYSRRDRARLAWICRARRVGFSLAEIREVIALFERAATRSQARATLLEVCRQRLTTLDRQRREIDGMMAELAGFMETIAIPAIGLGGEGQDRP